MCNSANALLVRDVVNDFVNQGRMFTAWDVTKEAKGRGADEPHYHLKTEIHAMFRNGEFQANNYTRSLAQRLHVSPQPFIYHNVMDDPDAYEDEILGVTPTTTSHSPTTQATSTATSVNGSIDRQVDSDGRLCLPKKFLVDLKLSDGDVVDVDLAADGSLKVQPHTSGHTPGCMLKVNKDGRVRIGPKVLGRSGRFDITVDEDEGVITVS